MKEVKKIELYEKHVIKYVADDGTEFDHEGTCRRYEYEKALEKLSVIEQCADIEGCPNFDGGECYESHGYTWYRPKNEQEIEMLNNAYDNPYDNYGQFNNDMIGEWVCVETDDADDFLWVTTLNNGIRYAKHILEKLGYDITITKKD